MNALTHLEALAALAEEGTMARAATRLRTTPSTVSRHLSALEAELGRNLVERNGRRVAVTPEGHRLLRDAAPALAALRDAVAGTMAPHVGTVSLGVSESVLSSWGAHLVADAMRAVPEVTLHLHAHRSPVVVDRVLGGELLLGIVAGRPPRSADLAVTPLAAEPMVIVPSGCRPSTLRGRSHVEVTTIEPRSGTWPALRPGLSLLRRTCGYRLEVTSTLESFASVVQVARAGLGHGLVPRGIALALGVPPRSLVSLPAPGLVRPILIVGRRPVLARSAVANLAGALLRTVPSGLRPG